MIHIRQLRKGDQPLLPEKSYSSHKELFAAADAVVSALPESERYNLFYTLGHGGNGPSRTWVKQDVMPFDIDGAVDKESKIDPKYLSIFFQVTHLDPAKTFTICSGNGVQLIVLLDYTIETEMFFDLKRKSYIRLCKEINSLYEAEGLIGRLDFSVFAKNRLMRLPGTENRKQGKPTTRGYVIQPHLDTQRFDLADEDASAFVTKEDLTNFAIDTPAVEAGCQFLQWTKANQDKVSEPQWYAMLSVVSRLDHWEQKIHDYSKEHKGYTPQEATRKANQARDNTLPRKCESINELWSKCSGCPHYRFKASPISIKGPEFIATEKNGFTSVSKNGHVTYHEDDLAKHFDKTFGYFVNTEEEALLRFTGTHYTLANIPFLKNYAEKMYSPKPKERHVMEFVNKLMRSNHADTAAINAIAENKINMKNGVYDFKEDKLYEHDRKFKFTYCLPFEFNKSADCPTFKKFMSDITDGDKELQDLMMEFVGYGLFEKYHTFQKSMLLLGDGGNGKSTFMAIVRALAGEHACSSVELHQMENPNNNYALYGKLFNLCEELPRKINETSMFKRLHGDVMTARRLYCNPINFIPTAKLIMAGNSLPSTWDPSSGFFRRLIIIPFNVRFDNSDRRDMNIVEKCTEELSGIFNLAMEHYKRLKARGSFTEAGKAKDILGFYEESVDIYREWWANNITVSYVNGPDKQYPAIPFSEIYTRFCSYVSAEGLKQISKPQLSKEIMRLLGQQEFKKRYKLIRDGKRVYKGFRGVEWTTPEAIYELTNPMTTTQEPPLC